MAYTLGAVSDRGLLSRAHRQLLAPPRPVPMVSVIRFRIRPGTWPGSRCTHAAVAHHALLAAWGRPLLRVGVIGSPCWWFAVLQVGHLGSGPGTKPGGDAACEARDGEFG